MIVYAWEWSFIQAIPLLGSMKATESLTRYLMIKVGITNFGGEEINCRGKIKMKGLFLLVDTIWLC